MSGRFQVLSLLISIWSLAGASANSSVVRLLPAGEIPAQLSIGVSHILSDSDSLYLGDSLLSRGVEYRFVTGAGYFDLSKLSSRKDKPLRLVYRPLPSWLLQWYGRELPDLIPAHKSPLSRNYPDASAQSLTSFDQLNQQKITLSGSKSFRFSSRTSGASSFSQTLDLALSGELTPGLELTGSVSDRGITPTYGTANNRLDEFDRLNLTLKSNNLAAQLGDVVISKQHAGNSGKAISGAAIALDFKNWQTNAILARPRGRFLTTRFFGRNGFQGPYTISEGGMVQAIVPGSETIWIDGQRQTRGTHNDYTMDYPLGRVTFSTNHPVDARTRIEVDFELRATDYKEELFSLGGGANSNDSTFFFNAQLVREGDDKDQSLLGELSDGDRQLLSSAGDSLATRTGVVFDSVGSYTLLIDSLPDSVFQYVGQGQGDYRVSFSFVGVGQGRYRFLGEDRYLFTGAGNGDYLPIVILPAAERLDIYRASLGFRPTAGGELMVETRGSARDKNLLSGIDDNDNNGLFYQVRGTQEWNMSGSSSSSYLTGLVHIKEAAFFSRERINSPDFNRRYHLPEGFKATTTERLYEFSGLVNLAKTLSLEPRYALLDYSGSYKARSGGIRAKFEPINLLSIATTFDALNSNLKQVNLSSDGEMKRFSTELEMKPSQELSLVTNFVRDERENEYFSEARGTRFSQLQLNAKRKGEAIRYEMFLEDSLDVDWSRSLRAPSHG